VRLVLLSMSFPIGPKSSRFCARGPSSRGPIGLSWRPPGVGLDTCDVAHFGLRRARLPEIPSRRAQPDGRCAAAETDARRAGCDSSSLRAAVRWEMLMMTCIWRVSWLLRRRRSPRCRSSIAEEGDVGPTGSGRSVSARPSASSPCSAIGTSLPRRTRRQEGQRTARQCSRLVARWKRSGLSAMEFAAKARAVVEDAVRRTSRSAEIWIGERRAVRWRRSTCVSPVQENSHDALRLSRFPPT